MAPRDRARRDYKSLIAIADQVVEIKGKGRRKTTGKIIKDAAEELFEKLEKDGKYTALEKTTVNWIRSNIGMTKDALAEWSKTKK